MPKDTSVDIGQMLSRLGGELSLSATRPNMVRYNPHAKQQEFHSSPAKNRLFLAGNRTGKSVSGVVEGLRYASGSHPDRKVPGYPNYGRVVGTDFPSGVDKVLLPLYQQWTPPSMLQKGSWEDSYRPLERTLTLANGSKIEFMSYDQSVQKFAGASRHWLHFDEEPPRLIYDECRARLIDTDGDWWMTLTPVLGLDYIYDDVYLPGKSGGNPDYGVIEASIWDNTHLSRSAIESYLNTLPMELRETREKGRFVQITGSVFPAFHKETHTISERAFRLGNRDRVYVSLDHGWRDHTAVLWHAVSPSGKVITFDELYINHTLTRDIASQILAKNASWGFDRPYIYVGDPAMKQTNATTGTNTVQEFARHGVPIAVEGISRDVGHGVEVMSSYLPEGEDGIPMWRIVAENCPNLTRQMATIRWQRRASRDAELELNKLIKIQDKDNHATDSARFFFTLMPNLAPSARNRAKGALDLAPFADTLGATQFGSRRDTGGWKYKPVDAHDQQFGDYE